MQTRETPDLMDYEQVDRKRRTLNLADSPSKDLLLRLLLVEVLEHVVNNSLDELSLLVLLLLLLEADPAVQDGLDLGREGNLLALNEGLRLEHGSLLKTDVQIGE